MNNPGELFQLDPAVTFLNHGSFGACPHAVFATYQNWQAKLERQPVEFLDPNRDFSKNMRTVRHIVASELGTTAESLVGLTNTTQALNIVAQSLVLHSGDEILTTEHEYAALEKAWTYVSRRSGVRIVVAKIPLPLTDETSFTQGILNAMTDRTRVLFLSHISSATALLFPIAPILQAARQRGIYSVVDGAHTPGQIPLHLDATGADFYAGNCHKWLLAPKGSAFLYVRPELQHLISPLVISHGWSETANNPNSQGPFGNSSFVDSLEVQGTRDPSAWLSVPAAIAFRRQYSWDDVIANCKTLAQETALRIAEITGLTPLSSPEFCAPQMVAIPLPDCDTFELQRALLEKYSIEIPCYRWQNRCLVRLSVQGYNTRQQMDDLVKALSELLPFN